MFGRVYLGNGVSCRDMVYSGYVFGRVYLGFGEGISGYILVYSGIDGKFRVERIFGHETSYPIRAYTGYIKGIYWGIFRWYIQGIRAEKSWNVYAGIFKVEMFNDIIYPC